jgi:hypothetical protein
MDHAGTMNRAFVLERAAECRALAHQARSRGIAEELEKLARDYDKDAARIDAISGDFFVGRG